MPKNIVLCCDGTNNQFDGDHTNVIRTYKIASKNASQTVFYDPGVGTIPEPWWKTRLGKRWSMVKGLAFGSGFSQNIADPYRFLMATYNPGDLVFLFGFSRGAYTVRALAGMLHSVGLLHPGTENLILYAQTYWKKDFGPDSPGGRLCAEFKATLARPCPVHFIGVWDTVGSVGVMNAFRTFPYTLRNQNVSHVRHAVSIDERRTCFRQNLMLPDPDDQDVKNVWFAGVHADVGGGYPHGEDGLAKVAFEWIIREASIFGLEIDSDAYDRELRQVGSAPDPCGKIHTSLKGLWWALEILPDRRYSFEDGKRHWYFSRFNEPRNVLRNADDPSVFIHCSVVDRLNLCDHYRPVNVPTDEAQLRERFQIEN